MNDHAASIAFDLDTPTVVFVTRGIHSDLRPQGIVLHHPCGLRVSHAPASASTAGTDDRADDAQAGTALTAFGWTEATEIVLWSDRSPHSVELLVPEGTLTIYNVWREGRNTFGLTGEAGISATDLEEGAVMVECSDGYPPAESVDLRVELAFWEAEPHSSEGDNAGPGASGGDSDPLPDGSPRQTAVPGQGSLDVETGDLSGSGDAPQPSNAEPTEPSPEGPRRLQLPRPGWLRAPHRPGGR